MRKCFITHAWRADREVEYLREEEPGYAVIYDNKLRAERVVPVDAIYFKDIEEWDDLL